MTNFIRSRVDQCKVVWYQWAYNIDDTGSIFNLPSITTFNETSLAETEFFDISDHIINCSFTKSLGEAAGSFSITLGNSTDWRRFMKPGEWISIYMSSDGSLPPPGISVGENFNSSKTIQKKTSEIAESLGLTINPNKPNLPSPNVLLESMGRFLRCTGVIERVSVRNTINSDGTSDLVYVVTGKDFGICLEETDLWFNMFYYEKSAYQEIARTSITTGIRKLERLMDVVFDAFYNPRKIFGNKTIGYNNLVENLKQWIIPKELSFHLNMPLIGGSYFGNLDGLKEFHQTAFENNMEDPVSGFEGIAWERLKELSQQEFHEFFTEIEDDGKLKVIFRPIPWALDKSNYPNLGRFIMNYKDLINPPNNILELPDLTSPNLDLESNVALLPQIRPFEDLNSFENPLKSFVSTKNFRKNHKVELTNSELFSFDVGQDFHSRFNHFYVDAVSQATNQLSTLQAISNFLGPTSNIPLKSQPSIKRHGIRKRHFKTTSYVGDSSLFTGNKLFDSPGANFIIECNYIQKDYWGKAEDFYSGSFEIVGKNSIKLGKVLVTDYTVQGAQEMAFYIEQYTDVFSINENGVGEWTQTLGVTRGIEINDIINKRGTKNTQPIESSGNLVLKGGSKK